MIPDPMTVTPSEHGLVRLFVTDLDPEGDAAITRGNVHKLLGDGVTLNPTKVEVTTSRAIETLGLTAYLSQGYGIADADLRGKSAALDALKGLIVLIPSSAFEKRPQTLDPKSGMRFIGLFREADAAPHEVMQRRSSAEVSAPANPGINRAAPSARRGSSWIVALGALIVAAALVLWVAR